MYVCMYVHTAPFCPRDLRARCDTGLGFENVDSIIPWQVHESAAAAVQSACESLGGERIEDSLAATFWQGLRDHSDEFFVGAMRAVQGGASLWRLSVPQTAPALPLSGEQLIEWGGAQRWLCTSTPAAQLREAAAAVGGHATLFRALDKSVGVFAPLSAPLARIHRQLKAAFDPDGVFNPGRLYPEL